MWLSVVHLYTNVGFQNTDWFLIAAISRLPFYKFVDGTVTWRSNNSLGVHLFCRNRCLYLYFLIEPDAQSYFWRHPMNYCYVKSRFHLNGRREIAAINPCSGILHLQHLCTKKLEAHDAQPQQSKLKKLSTPILSQPLPYFWRHPMNYCYVKSRFHLKICKMVDACSGIQHLCTKKLEAHDAQQPI